MGAAPATSEKLQRIPIYRQPCCPESAKTFGSRSAAFLSFFRRATQSATSRLPDRHFADVIQHTNSGLAVSRREMSTMAGGTSCSRAEPPIPWYFPPLVIQIAIQQSPHDSARIKSTFRTSPVRPDQRNLLNLHRSCRAHPLSGRFNAHIVFPATAKPRPLRISTVLGATPPTTKTPATGRF